MKKYTTLKSEFQIQEKDKELLLKQLLMKKKENAVLKSQVEQYEKLLNEVSKQMEDNERIELDNSRSKNNELVNSSSLADSKFGVIGNPANGNQSKRYQNTIAHLNNVLQKQHRKIRELKNLYMKEIGNKSDLQKIIRKLVDDVRESIIQIEKDKNKRKRGGDDFDLQARQKLMEKILNNEKILTLIYDKTFYSGNKNNKMDSQEIPEELEGILEND